MIALLLYIFFSFGDFEVLNGVFVDTEKCLLSHAYRALVHCNVLPQAWHSEMVFLRKDVSFTCKHVCKHTQKKSGLRTLRTLNKGVKGIMGGKVLPAE